MPDVFWEQVDLHAGVRAVGEIEPLAAPMHRPIVGRRRHIREHRGVDIVGENALEYEMIERRVKGGSRVNRGDHKIE
jgi:hypothetical protein